MLPLAIFGIESSGLSLAIDLVLLFLVVLYLALIYWTYDDARRRILDPILVGCSTAASLFPFVGTLVYIVLRPPEYLEDVRERELEMQAAEARLYEIDHNLCPHCDYRIERDYIRCPSCLKKLKERCVSCAKPLEPSWTICPYCETEVPGTTKARRTRRRRAAVAEEDLPELDGARAQVDEDPTEVSEELPRLGEPATRAGDEISKAGARASSRRSRPSSSRAGRPRPSA
jgi:hypothetical protein